MKIKSIIDNAVLILLLSTFLAIMMYSPLVIDLTSEFEYSLPSYIIKPAPQKKVNPISNYEFNHTTKIYIYLERFDRSSVPDGIENTTFFVCEDKEIIKEFQEKFVFRPVQADVRKSESYIYIYQNDKLVFKSALVLKNNLVGIQNEKNEFVEIDNQTEFVNVLAKFERSYFPFWLLRD